MKRILMRLPFCDIKLHNKSTKRPTTPAAFRSCYGMIPDVSCQVAHVKFSLCFFFSAQLLCAVF